MKAKKGNICFVGSMLGKNPGYITTQGQIVADLLASEGFNVSCVSSKINRISRLAEIITTILRKFRQLDAVVLEVYSGLSLIIGEAVGLLCRTLKIPLVMVLHGGNLPEYIEQYPQRTKRVLKRADCLIAPSQFLAEKIGSYGFSVRVIPNIIELEKYPFRKREEIQPRLIWMRSFHPIYNPQMAIEVLSLLKKSEPTATLIMAGVDKGLESEVRKLAEKLKVSDAVRFTGFLDEQSKIKEFSSADIYLNTNLIDNMPVSVVEACAFGLPVVATNVGGLPFLISHTENGLLVENKNAEKMCEAVILLLKDSLVTAKISQNARRLAESFSWQTVKKEWINLFDEIRSESLIQKPVKLSNNPLKIEEAGR